MTTSQRDPTMPEFTFPTRASLSSAWQILPSPLDASHYLNPRRNLRVLASFACPERRDSLWIHVSYSHRHSTPAHATTCLVKHLFIGDDREAFIILPPADRYVNTMPYCLHLWSPLNPNHKPLPQFESLIPGLESLGPQI
jgi:hypothetical protein